jgi:MFS family permease
LGRLSDKIGRRPVLIASLLSMRWRICGSHFPMIFCRCLRRVFLPGWQLAIPG